MAFSVLNVGLFGKRRVLSPQCLTGRPRCLKNGGFFMIFRLLFSVMFVREGLVNHFLWFRF